MQCMYQIIDSSLTPKPIIEAYEMTSETKESFSTTKSSSDESSSNEQLDHTSSISRPPEPSSITSEANITEGKPIVKV